MTCPKCQVPIGDDSRFCSKCGASISSSDDTPTRTELQSAAAELAPGTMVGGKFRILEVAGRGGMGVVYKAEDTKLRRTVALKFLPTELAASLELRDRFLVEARAAAGLSHPNICTIHEIHDQEERPFIEMEYVEGRSLRARVKEGPLAPGEAAEIALQVAEALEEAHGKGIVHRDIKSANIMVTAKGQAMVMDFGLAKVIGDSLHTREGATLGTAAYMSPEQAQGQSVDHRTDVWSMGVVMYEMLSGRLPFAGERGTAILYSVVHAEPKPLQEVRSGVPAELCRIVNRALKKDLKARYASAAEMAGDLKKYRDSVQAEETGALTPRAVLRALRKPKVAIPALACLLTLCAAGGWFFHRQSRIRWAREQALPEIQRLVLSNELSLVNFSKAYRLAVQAERHIPHDPVLSGLLEKCAKSVSITTDPPGADVYMKGFSSPDEPWQHLGASPLNKIRLPAGYFRWRFQKDGYETVEAVAPDFRSDPKSTAFLMMVPSDIHRRLDPRGKVPPGMVRVSGAKTSVGQLDDFYIDTYEVTNLQYKEFVDRGGYRDPKYWKQKFVREGRELSWAAATAGFRDQTGRPGPSTWQAGEYPKGQQNYPVSGVSWHEAAAYAEFAGRTLPTIWHWEMAAGLLTPLRRGLGWLGETSNFKNEFPTPVGSYPSMTSYGAYDLPGNVREWCWNETREGRALRGGAWNDATYMLEVVSQAPAFDRSPKNGFRCALYPDPRKIPAKAFGAFQVTDSDFRRQTPVPDSIFQVYKEQFAYDAKELRPHLEWQKDCPDWVEEKVTLDAAYGNERLPIYLFLPKGSSPPYQTVLYFPGAGSAFQESSQHLDQYWEFERLLSFVVKNGRAVLYPVYKGTFERREDALTAIRNGAPTRQYTEYLVQLVKDLKRSADYIEIRKDIDRGRLAYFGFSWGGLLGPVMLASEDRLRTGILVVGGVMGLGRPETREIHYLPRVKAPTLMLNGKYDTFFPLDTNVKPMFDLLGTPVGQKELRIYEADHFVPQNEVVKETLAWLDRYLGPVK